MMTVGAEAVTTLAAFRSTPFSARHHKVQHPAHCQAVWSVNEVLCAVCLELGFGSFHEGCYHRGGWGDCARGCSRDCRTARVFAPVGERGERGGGFI